MTREASFWTAERDAAAQALWRKGLSGREVARRLGAVSQNAVIGRMWRLGAKRTKLASQQNQQAGMAVRRTAAAAGRGGWPRRALPGLLPTALNGPGSGPPLVEHPLPQQTPVLCSPRPWLTRENWECAYPVAGEGVSTLSCCNTPVRRGYCAAHRAAIIRVPVRWPEPARGDDAHRRADGSFDN